MDVIHETESLTVTRGRRGGVSSCVVRICGIPSEEEAWRLLEVLRLSVYASFPGGFLLIYDLADLEMATGDSKLCYDRALMLANFYNGVDMQELRLRASEVVIITQNGLLRYILNMIMTVYPSPVKVSCCDSMASAALPGVAGRGDVR